MPDDKSIIGSLLKLLSGTCRHCGCHGDECAIGGGDKCYCMNSDIERTVCSAPGCLTK